MSSNLEVKKSTYLNLNNRISEKNSLGKVKCNSGNKKIVTAPCECAKAHTKHRVNTCEELSSCESRDKAEANSKVSADKIISQQHLPIKKRKVVLELQSEEPLDLSISHAAITESPLDLSFCRVEPDSETGIIDA